MIVYHGSPEVIRTPEYGKGPHHGDYGPGFYCTESLEMAGGWACPTSGIGFVNIYDLDLSDLRVIDLTDGGFHILNQVALLLVNRRFVRRSPISERTSEYIIREFLPDTTGYDVIRGYCADDSYFTYVGDFLDNTVSLRQLSDTMGSGERSEQVVLMSPKAFEGIRFVGYEAVDGSIYNNRRMKRDRTIRSAYCDHDPGITEDDLFARDILMQGVMNDDPHL